MMDPEERELFELSLAKATESATGDALDAALVEIGWRDALGVDRRVAVKALFELQGKASATSSALGVLMADALGLADASILLPWSGTWEPPGRAFDDHIEVHGLGLGALARAEETVVVLADGDGYTAAVVATKALSLRSIGGLDPAFGLAEVTGDISPEFYSSRSHAVAWPAAVAAGQIAIAHELIGASRTMLSLARDHALERIQFGQPIAKFQAVRHRLAEALIAIETADAATSGAWEEGTNLGAAAAKAVAGRSARTVARHCQQVLAGIGFTAEHPLHRYVRRVLVLDGLLGDAKTLTWAMGEELLRTRRLPPMLPL